MKKWLLLLICLALLALATVWLTDDLPSADALLTRSSPDTTKLFDRHGRLLFELLDPRDSRAGRRTRIALNELPLHFRHAILAVEDANFYAHSGVDVVGVVRAIAQAVSEGRIVSGGSTITQQLAREVLLSRAERETRTVTRKLREMILAWRITQAYSKDTILEMYLNEVYFGQLAYGAEAAARTYFGKAARELDLAEAALLAGLIQSPASYNPLVNIDAARERQRVVLGLMVKHGYIDKGQAELAQNEALHFASSRLGFIPTMHAPHFVVYVRNLLEARYGAAVVNRGGLRVTTTLDLDLQERAETIVRQRLAELRRRTFENDEPDYNVHNAALVVIDPTTGEILAMVGSADYFDASIDGAVNVALAQRQPGSAIKPITYATALAKDYTAATVLSDVPTTFLTKENEPYAPQNYDRTWHGPITLRRALATSSNMIAVKVLDHVGVQAMIETARALGITTFNDSERFGLALTLGGGEVTLLELTAAYAAFANYGKRVTPMAIRSVDIGYWLLGRSPNSQYPISNMQSLSPQVAYLITDILSDDFARMPAFGENSMLKLSRPAAAKTGTTTDFRDNWTVGYTPDLAVGVWVGNANNEAMYKISGITGAGPIWRDFMEEALKGKATRTFERPDGLVKVEICESSGLLPTDLCPRRRMEWFIVGAEPIRYDDSYRALTLDATTNLLWADGCKGSRITRVFYILPPDAQAWGRKQGIEELPIADCRLQMVQLTEDGRPKTEEDVQLLSSVAHLPSLLVTSPAPNSVFALSSQLPADAQQIEVSARLNANVMLREVTLFVDGQPLATFTRAPYRALWRLTAGEHEVKAVGVDGDGRRVESESVRFRVETGQ
jgi:1A family penicillin-binding protein